MKLYKVIDLSIWTVVARGFKTREAAARGADNHNWANVRSWESIHIMRAEKVLLI